MENLLAARAQMGVSLAFHIIFSCIAMVMPFFMVIAHGIWLKRGEKVYGDLTRVWLKGVAILFATGAVSGTVLSFELGLLWPRFMEHAGPIIGMPFSWEGAAFFVESIAIGLFIYGWGRMSPWLHWTCGLIIGIAGVTSGIFIMSANSWMNSPSGFDWVNGQATNINPWQAMFNAAWFDQALHMTLAAFVATGFAVAGIHAFLLLKDPKNLLHQKALKIALPIASIAALLQPISGDVLAKGTASRQPIKLAALEAHYETKAGAPLILGGLVDEKNETVSYAVKIPKLLSFITFGDWNATVKGLHEFEKTLWPPIAWVHGSFQLMVAIGFFLVILAFFYFLFSLIPRWRLHIFHPRFLKLVAFSTPLGFLALEAGWIVTELGRQPWIIYGIFKTSEAVTPMPHLIYPFLIFTGLYLILSGMLIWLLIRQARAVRGYT